MIWPFGKKNGVDAGAKLAAPAVSMADIFAAAAREVDAQIAADPEWFPHLPYKGAMSKDQARHTARDREKGHVGARTGDPRRPA